MYCTTNRLRHATHYLCIAISAYWASSAESEERDYLLLTKIELSDARERESCSSRNSARPYAVLPGLEQSRLAEQLKDSREKAFKLDIEIKSLKAKNKALEMNISNINSKLKLANETSEKYKKMYKDATSGTVRAQKLVSLKNELDQCRIDLKEKSQTLTETLSRLTQSEKEVKSSRAEAEKLKLEVQDQSKKCHALKEKCNLLQQTLDDLKGTCNHSCDQHKQDLVRIHDLERQVREMEHVVRSGQHIVYGQGGEGITEVPSATLVKFLENRIQQLTEQLTERGASARTKLQALEVQFTAIKENYETYINELEHKLANLAAERDTNKAEPRNAASRSPTRKTDRTDMHLLTTVRALQVELSSKEKELHKITKELNETKAAANRMRPIRHLEFSKVKKTGVSVVHKSSQTSKTYFETSVLTTEVSDLQQETRFLRDQISKLTNINQRLTSDLAASNSSLTSLAAQSQQAFTVLKNRHHEEIQKLKCQQSRMLPASQVTELETQVLAQQALIDRLKDELQRMHGAKQDAQMLKLEKEHLESCIRTLSREVSELRQSHKPESEQLILLRSKLNELEQHNQEREVRLQTVMQEVMQHRPTQQQTSPAEVTTLRLALKHKNIQINNFQAELSRLMSTLAALQSNEVVE